MAKTIAAAKLRANQAIAEAMRQTDRPKCRGKVKLRDEAGEVRRDEAGNVLTRPCKQFPIRGGAVCPRHGGSAPQVKKAAARRLLAMVEPSLVRLGELMDQDEHPPTALGAIRTVLERAGTTTPIGALNKDSGGDTRPVINIGIAVGGMVHKVEALLPAAAAEVVEGELDDE